MISKPNKENEAVSPRRDRIAARVAHGILTLQAKVSDRMNKLKSIKIILIGFCLLCGSLSLYFFIDAFASKPKTRVTIERIHPVQTIEEPENIYDPRIPDEIYQQIQDYKRYADSTGESIRPGLADSMRVLEEMYLQQKK